MTTATDLLTLSQWLSPAFPVGAFTYSHGLEVAVAEGWISDADSLQDWLEDLLTQGSARSDALLLAAAFHAEDPAEVDALARAVAASAERLRETEEQGRAFAEVVGRVWGPELAGLSYPVALGVAVAREGLDLHMALSLFLQAFVSNLAAAAQRLAPIGQTAAQRVIRALAPLVAATAAELADGDLTRLASAAFRSDISAMRHETMHTRIFRS
jgi:urease accessory protein